MGNPDAVARLKEQVDRVKEIIEQLYLAMVVNTATTHSLDEDYEKYSVLTEYYSEGELEEVLTGFRNLGLYVEVFLGEAEFLNALANGTIRRAPFRHKLVYGTVPSGIWRGRDALIPALCGANELVYCGPDAYAMSLLGNKQYSFGLAAAYGLPVAPFWIYDPKGGWLNNAHPATGTRVIAKPVLECASIGIDEDAIFTFVPGDEARFAQRMERFGQRCLVQEFVPGFEAEVPVLGTPEPLAIGAMGIEMRGNPLLGDRILSYDVIWEDAYTFYDFAGRDPVVAAAMDRVAETVCERFDLTGLARIDFRITTEGCFYITDMNSIPHLTRFSSCAASFMKRGLGHGDMLAAVLASALATGRR